MRTATLLTGALIFLALVAGAVWHEFGRELKAVQARGDVPGMPGEPFFPAQDPRADALAGAVRTGLNYQAWAADQDSATPSDKTPEAASVESATKGEDVDSATAHEPSPLEEPTAEKLLSQHPSLSSVDPASDTWILSLYVPNPGKNRPVGPFLHVLKTGALAATEALWDQVPQALRNQTAIDAARIKVDLVIGDERAFPYNGGLEGVTLDEGIDGIVLRHPKEDPFYFLPSLAVEEKVSRRKLHGRARYKARTLGGWRKSRTKKAEFAAFRSRSWVEPVGGGLPLVPLARGNADVPEITAELLKDRIALAVDYLVRETNSEGRITYDYEAALDKTDTGYNILRHAGTVYSMMQAHRISRDPRIAEASLRGIEYYERKMKEDDDNPGEWFVLDGRRAKLGGVGLGLCMLAEMEKSVPGSVDMERMYGMARHIERMQQPDGSFKSFYNHDGREKSKRKSIYYSGEAILGLLRVHQLTGDSHWLDVAIKGADYLVNHRWVSMGVRIYVPPDAWLIQALEEMDRVAPDDRRADYAFQIAEVIARNKLMNPATAPEDLLGADISSPRSMPNAATAGAFGEALTAAARLEARRRPGETRMRTFAMYNAEFQLRNQYWGANSYSLSNPARAYGGFRVKPDAGEIRNDYVQHNLSGLFGLLDLLDDSAPDIGWIVPEERRPAWPGSKATEASK